MTAPLVTFMQTSLSAPERAKTRSSFTDGVARGPDRKSTRLDSSHLVISYAVFCLKNKNSLLRRAIEAISCVHLAVPHATICVQLANDPESAVAHLVPQRFMPVQFNIDAHASHRLL